MSTNSRHQDRTKKYNDILKNLTDFYSEQTRKLIERMYKDGYSYQEIANTLGVTRASIANRFPKKGAQ